MMTKNPDIPECEFQKDENFITLTLKGNPDAGSFTCTCLQPGVYFAYNDIRSRYWPAYNQNIGNTGYLTINICLDGRCETALSDGRYAIVSAGQLAMGTQQPQAMFYYPTECYKGVEFFIDLEIAGDSDRGDYLSLSGIRIAEILKKFRCEDRLFFCSATEEIRKLSDHILMHRFTDDPDSLRLYTAMLLHMLQDLEIIPENPEHFTKAQIEIAQNAERQLCEDLSARIPAKTFADQYGISETSFKNYFKGVFGESFPAYSRRKRMELAAGLLKYTNQKVIDIAIQAGYENQGKFAGVFKSYSGMSPLEYRRMCRLTGESRYPRPNSKAR